MSSEQRTDRGLGTDEGSSENDPISHGDMGEDEGCLNENLSADFEGPDMKCRKSLAGRDVDP